MTKDYINIWCEKKGTKTEGTTDMEPEGLTGTEKIVMEKYGDIINLPHHVSPNRPRMPLGSRAAQFASFAALSGYEDAIDETARAVNEGAGARR